MLKIITPIFLMFFFYSVASGEDTPEANLIKAKLLCEEKIKEANLELKKAQKTRIKEIKLAIKEYDEALEQVKIHWTKQGDLQKALSFKEQQGKLRFKSIMEYMANDSWKKFETKENNSPEDQQITKKQEATNNKTEEINNTAEVVHNQVEKIDTSSNNTESSHGTVNNFDNTPNIDNTTIIAPEDVLSFSFNEQSLKDYGYSVNDSCITGPIIEGNEAFFLSNNTYKFNGKCEFCFKIKARWYHGAMLLIDDKVYYVSYGHWANNGAKIITNGEFKNTNSGPKIIENDKVETKLKGKEYKVSRNMQTEWNEIKIVIDNGNISYFYNGNEIHKDSVDIPKGAKLQCGFSTYRCEMGLKDFSLKLQ